MTKNLMAVISAVLFVALLAFVVRAWRSKAQAQASEMSQPNEALEYFGELLTAAKGFYVATTFANNHLDRIAAYGLGPRGVAQVMVFTEGLLIVRTGESPLAIDRSQISSVTLGQTAIDKAVEPGGLLQVNWSQGSTDLTTHLRITDLALRSSLIEAISNITMKEGSK